MFCSKCGVDDNQNVICTSFRQDGNTIYLYSVGKCSECGSDIIEKETFESEWHEDISMETFLEENPNFSFEKEKVEKVEKSSKLIIHETDCHGCGWVYYNKSFTPYSYDDETGDIRSAVEELVRLGFIKPEQVLILEGEQLYHKLAELLERE